MSNKQEYCKVSVSIGIGNRKSSVLDPVEVETKCNSFDGELNTLVINFLDAVCSLPSDTKYTQEDVINSVCDVFELQRRNNG